MSMFKSREEEFTDNALAVAAGVVAAAVVTTAAAAVADAAYGWWNRRRRWPSRRRRRQTSRAPSRRPSPRPGSARSLKVPGPFGGPVPSPLVLVFTLDERGHQHAGADSSVPKCWFGVANPTRYVRGTCASPHDKGRTCQAGQEAACGV
jgi:hypothetical protein